MEAIPNQAENRLPIYRLGLWLFILSESFLFIALLMSRFYLQGMHRPAELNQPLGFAISIILVLSSLTAYRCETAASFGDQKRFRHNILFTIGLGGLFLVGVGLEWAEGFNFFPPTETAYGAIFFTLTGFHAFHVLTGVLALLVVFWRSRKISPSPKNFWWVEATVKYWHFVDVVWIFIFPTLYLVS